MRKKFYLPSKEEIEDDVKLLAFAYPIRHEYCGKRVVGYKGQNWPMCDCSKEPDFYNHNLGEVTVRDLAYAIDESMKVFKTYFGGEEIIKHIETSIIGILLGKIIDKKIRKGEKLT